MNDQKFRTDIEGLRALAVVPILAFHLDARVCPGGFAGVDVFFVISGYLITRMILAGGAVFSFKAFYVRRFFRLFPALLTTLIASLIAGWWILGPPDYEALALSAIASVFGVSNFYFLQAVDYFNAASQSHPLLHTWSLGVEEQFYLVWPALLVLTRRWGAPLWLVAASMAGLSLFALGRVQSAYPQMVFYMMPSRIFEFAMGAVFFSFEGQLAGMPVWVRNLAGAWGAALLALSFAYFDGQTPWPSLWTLAPALGTIALIFAGRAGLWNGFLSNGVLRFFGKTSYSLYLVHWPVITLYRSHAVIEPGPLELAVLGAVSVALGAFLYAAVELPFRVTKHEDAARHVVPVLPFVLPRRIFTAGLALSCAAFLTAATGIVIEKGFSSRLDGTRVQLFNNGLTFAGDICSNKAFHCLFGDPNSRRVVYLIGDSHALNLLYGLDRLFRDAGIKGVALYDHGCLFAPDTTTFLNGVADATCAKNVKETYAYIARDRHPVILASDYMGGWNTTGENRATAPLHQSEDAYYDWLAKHLQVGLDAIDAGHRTVIVVKQAYSTGVNLAKCLAQPGAPADADQPGGKCEPMSRAQAQLRRLHVDQMIDAIAATSPAVVTIDPKAVFCSKERCTVSDGNGLFFRDATHLTNAGSDYLIQKEKSLLLEAMSKPSLNTGSQP